MAPFKSTLARSVGKLLGVYKETDLSLRGVNQTSRFISGAIPFNVEYIVIAGGGGGGFDCGGGGGAGGYRTANNFGVSTLIEYTVTVGTGGNGAAPTDGRKGFSGTDSIFATITSAGGGGGGSAQGGTPPEQNGGDGGSGGGNRRTAGTPGAGNIPPASPSPPQGNPGGPASVGGQGSPGGGGAGGAGAQSPSTSGGAGGAGVTNPLLSPINSGQVAGGGGGGADTSPINRGPGTSGGGDGGRGSPLPDATPNQAQPGVTNTGGGGGGGGNLNSSAPGRTGGNGAPGLVALVYPTSITFSKTGSLAHNSPAPAPSSRTITIFTSGTGSIEFADS